MPSCEPENSGLHVNRVIHLQSRNSRASNRSFSCDGASISPPLEVLLPTLVSWIEERFGGARDGIEAERFDALCEITRGAGQCEIRSVIGSTPGGRNNVFQVKSVARYQLRRMTIFTSVASADFDDPTKRGPRQSHTRARASARIRRPVWNRATVLRLRAAALR